jgi:hypothetical protein
MTAAVGSLAMLWLVLAAIVVAGRYPMACQYGWSWEWREEIPRALRSSAIGTVVLLAGAQLHFWSPELFWLLVAGLVARWVVRYVRRREVAPDVPQWTEDQL